MSILYCQVTLSHFRTIFSVSSSSSFVTSSNSISTMRSLIRNVDVVDNDLGAGALAVKGYIIYKVFDYFW